MADFIINADSTPVLDGLSLSDYWGKPEWVKWVSANVKKYNKETAASRFNTEWQKQSTFASPFNWYKYDSDFVDFLNKTIGVDISNFVSSPVTGANKLVKGVGQAAGNVGSGIGNAGKALKYAIPIAIVLVLIVIVLVIYKKTSNLVV